MSAIDSKNLLVWVKAMSRGKALPLDASEVHESFAAAQTYSETAIAYPGQTVKALMEDGKYHEYILQPGESGYTLEEVGAVKQSDLKQYVQVVDALPTTGEEGIIYIVQENITTDIVGLVGYVYRDNEWVQVFNDGSYTNSIVGLKQRMDAAEEALDTKAPIADPVFTGTVKVGEDEVAVKSYVDGLISNLASKTPTVINSSFLVDTPKAGTTYRVAEAGTYFGHNCEIGDLIIVLKDGNSKDGFNSEDFMVIQANIDGAVTSTAETSTVGEIVVFDAVTGKVIKGSGVQIASLNDAIAKAHEHTNKANLDTYDKTQTELLAAAKTEAEGLVNTLSGTVDDKLADKADKATTLAGYGIADAYTKTEIDGKVQTITDNLNTKISSTDADTKIATAKEETLEEAATAATEILEARVGTIDQNTTIKAYIDTAVGSGGTASAAAIAEAKTEAINTSKGYTDTQIASALAVVNF